MPYSDQNEITSTLVQDLLREKRADRRWKNIRFLAWFALFIFVILSIINMMGTSTVSSTILNNKYAALVRLDGMIAPGRDFSAETVIPTLKDAFTDKKAEGVVIDINSPGGTPVQAAIIHDAILYFKEKYHKKVIVIGEDLLTSGAYYVAVAGDQIYVNPNSLTGSIGVIVKGFGFVDLIKKIGIERRVYTAGSQKDRLDPFLPQNPEDMQKIQDVMGEVHQNFVRAVLAGRRGKIKGDPSKLFTGDFWSGQQALQLGLVDGLGNLMDVTEKEFHTTELKEYGGTGGFLRLLEGQLGSSFDKLFYMSAL